MRRLTTRVGLIAILVMGAVVIACGSDSNNSGAAGAGSKAEQVTLRLGYFPNITHAQPLVGIAQGTFAQELGANVKLATKTFNAGPSAIEALFAGEIDAAYVGPNPTINGFVKSSGKEVRIIAGATSAGAQLIVRTDSGIQKPSDFANKKVATPQIGNTQDVALRSWLKANGLNDREHGGNVQVIPTENANTLALFQKGDIQAAWVPELWATRLVEAGGRVFLDERDLWPNGDFVTTDLIVRPKFLQDHPDVVERLLRAHVKTTLWINDHPDEAKQLVNQSIAKLTNAKLPESVVNSAWRNMKVTYDPLASTLRKTADDAFNLGFLGDKKPDLSTIYALDPLNKVLAEQQLPPVAK